MRAFIFAVLVGALIGVAFGAVVVEGQSGSGGGGCSGCGGGGGGGSGFTDCFECDNIFFGFWHCDGEGGEMVAGGIAFHPCPTFWPGSCQGEHPEPCGSPLATPFHIDRLIAGVLSGCGQAESAITVI